MLGKLFCVAAVFQIWRKRGSSRSRSQSPRKLNDMTVSKIAIPGNVRHPPCTVEIVSAVANHYSPGWRWRRDSGARKLSEDSARISCPTLSEAMTIIVLTIPGKRWRIINLKVEAPATLADET